MPVIVWLLRLLQGIVRVIRVIIIIRIIAGDYCTSVHQARKGATQQ